MTGWDIFIAPFVLALIFTLLSNARRRITDKVLRSYFSLGFRVKLVGAIGLGVLYQFYYGRGVGVGDTFTFFRYGDLLTNAFWEAPFTWLKIMWVNTSDITPDMYPYIGQNEYYAAGDFRTINVIRVTSLLSILAFGTYLGIAFFFALISFTGVWAMYRVFYDMYPNLHRPLAYAVFFIPSVYFWGSGLVKDSLSLGALGWFFYGFYFGLIRREKLAKNMMVLILAAWALYGIKHYILFAFSGGMMLWLFLQYRANVKNPLLRFLLLPIMLVGGVAAGYYTIVSLAQSDARYNLENAINTAKVSAEWLEQVGQREGGSVYSLGITDWSPTGLLSITPRAVWLSIFQPHPWQARNVIMLLAAIEATFFLWLTLRVLFSNNIFKVFNAFFENPILLLCLVFTVILGIAVSISTNNYGSLVRYRIPYQPFYLAMLYILRYKLRGSTSLW